MSLSVGELDQTVKQFYEGRGEVVCFDTTLVTLRLHLEADSRVI